MKRTRSAAFALAAVLALPVPAAAFASAKEAVGTLDGGPRATLTGCTDTFVLVEGDEEAVRSAVPGGYRLGGEVPVGAQLWSISSSCDTIRVGNAPPSPGTIAFLGASVQAPDGLKGPEDIHSYLFWAVTSDKRLQRRLATAGFPAYYAAGTRQTTSSGVVLGHSVLEVPWRVSPYRIAASVTPAATHPHNHDAHWWYDTTAGAREVLVRLAFSSENVADCAVTTGAGTRLAMLLGATERATSCFLQRGTASTIEF